jgi:hypothetical protein
MPDIHCSVEDAPQVFDFITGHWGVLIAFGGPQGHGDSLTVGAPFAVVSMISVLELAFGGALV